MPADFLPVCQKDLEKRGWRGLDIIIVTGDAYVDHPYWGSAIISRLLESRGYKVGIISQPDWRDIKDFTRLGAPRLFFGITSGNVDSMVANYNSGKKLRVKDDYSPRGQAGLRPDRALIVYANRIRQAFGRIPIVLGGLEASTRRFAHYDWWDNKVRRSVLLDSKADILVYGMGERQVLEIAERLSAAEAVDSLNNIPGTVVDRKDTGFLEKCLMLPSFEEATSDKNKFNLAFKLIYRNRSPFKPAALAQKHGDRFIVQFAGPKPLSRAELDGLYKFNYARNYHPVYEQEGGVPALETVKFSITSHRGCAGECSFCALSLHQGRIIQSRSEESILAEAETISKTGYFKGTITDVGGPTANLYKATCALWDKDGFCENKNCLFPVRCPNLKLGYRETLGLLKKIKGIKNIKHVFISSGLRHDLLTDDCAQEYLEEIMKNHISGYMKVAPEHICPNTLEAMRKPALAVYEKFLKRFDNINKKISKKCFLVSYFITSHPASELKDALKLALYIKEKHLNFEQIQDFMPIPMTISACLYYTGYDPLNGNKVYNADTFRERKKQRALVQYKNACNRELVREALNDLGAGNDLVAGYAGSGNRRLQRAGRRKFRGKKSRK